MRRIRNPVYGSTVTWVRIPPSPPSTCPIRDRDSIDVVNRALTARFCVLGSGLVRGHIPTIARFLAEVSSREFRQFGTNSLQFPVVRRLAPCSAVGIETRESLPLPAAELSNFWCLFLTSLSIPSSPITPAYRRKICDQRSSPVCFVAPRSQLGRLPDRCDGRQRQGAPCVSRSNGRAYPPKLIARLRCN